MLIALTSRVVCADISVKDSVRRCLDALEAPSDEAVAELLRDNDVRGMTRSKGSLSRVRRPPLALTLLASLLKETQVADVCR